MSGVEACEEVLVLGELAQPVTLEGAEQPGGIAAHLDPQLRVDRLEEVLRGWVP